MGGIWKYVMVFSPKMERVGVGHCNVGMLQIHYDSLVACIKVKSQEILK